MNVLQALAYPPILRGFVALVVAGCFFPLAGVFILRLNLVTLRFTLMHAALLGAAVGLALHVDPLLVGLALDVLAIAAISRVARESGLAGALAGSEPGGPGRLSVRLEKAPFDALIEWLAHLAQQNGVAVDSATIEKAGAPGQVNAAIVLHAG